MFGRQPQKNQPQDNIDLELDDINFSRQSPSIVDRQQATVLQNELTTEKSELVNTVEKISRIISPYFVVIVGLAVYEKNFLIGTILILVGILSLLKVTARDIATFFEWVKNFLGLGNT